VRNLIKKIFISLFIIVSVGFFVILNPALYFSNCFAYKNFRVYSGFQLPKDATRVVLDEVQEMIETSQLYDPDVKIKIFVRDNFKSHSWMPWQFNAVAYGQVIPLAENIFIGNAHFESNKAYNPKGLLNGESRDLSKVLAHEITHVFIFRNSYKKWLLNLLNQANWSEIGLLWKEEGYAEYIAREWDSDLAYAVLNETDDSSHNFSKNGKEYCSYLLAIRHLIENKGMTIAEILDAELQLQDLLFEIKEMHDLKRGYENPL
jgi:hypothetical protein